MLAIDRYEEACHALRHISPNLSRDLWLRVGMALKNGFGDAGFAMFDDWSKGGESYREADVRSTWDSIDPEGGVTLKTLFWMAEDGGFQRSSPYKRRPTDPEQLVRLGEQARYRQIQRQKHQEEAASTALILVSQASEATIDHPYLLKKQVHPSALLYEVDIDTATRILGYRPAVTDRQSGQKVCLEGRLLIAPFKQSDNRLSCIEMIDEQGRKAVNAGGMRAGAFWSPVDLPKISGLTSVLVGEGVATCLTVYQATGIVTVAAGSATNLPAVTCLLRKHFPDAVLGVLADLGNGEALAERASRDCGARLIKPVLPNGSTGNDFNDMARELGDDGMAKVKELIEQALEEVSPVVRPPAPERSDEPLSFGYGGGRFDVNREGVWHQASPNHQGTLPAPQWICSELHVIAKTRTGQSEAWGRLLAWHDDDGVRHQWAMPNELLQGDGVMMRQELARLGLQIAPGNRARELLSLYLSFYPCDARARCVDRLGWHGSLYVTPGGAIGPQDELVVFQNLQAIETALALSGSLEAWRGSVAALARGNSRLVFALSVAFAAPVVDIVRSDSGGFHFRGKSSSGKTTALKVAASIWGDPATYPRLWRATTNGLEGLAALHNDGLLILDELSQIDPTEVGEAAYLLANGQGKSRASKSGAVRTAARWRLLFLSAGEESLSMLMAKAGKKANAGQEIRLADIDADAGAGYGMFEELHGHPTPAALAMAIKDATVAYHGAVGVEWLRHIVRDRPQLGSWVKIHLDQFIDDVVPKDAPGQVIRVAQRFGLAAVAGELATHYGLTGWPEGEAIAAAKKCLSAWLSSFGGTGSREDRTLLSQVKAFFEAHGSSRFEEWDNTGGRAVVNRAGFRKTDAEGRSIFYVLPEAFKEICRGFEPKMAGKALVQAGWIEPDPSGGYQQKPRLPSVGPTRCYVFTARLWESDHAA